METSPLIVTPEKKNTENIGYTECPPNSARKKKTKTQAPSLTLKHETSLCTNAIVQKGVLRLEFIAWFIDCLP